MAIVLRSGMTVGSISAEDDERFLRDCFILTDATDQIRDINNKKCVVVGRTGAGKSAILWNIENEEQNVIRINPESLSLNYISNSDIIKTFDEIGIKLDVFYQLLWRHIFAVELIKAKKNLDSEHKSKTFIQALFTKFTENHKKTKALQYLFQFGDSFWADTEERIREVVSNIEAKLSDEAGIDLKALKLSSKDESTHSRQVVTEVINKAQSVVNQVQIQELENVIDLLSEDIFDDKYEKYYIILDDLDRDWAHEEIRFKLIRALIETLKKFKRIQNVKIIISLRSDLLQTVLERTASSGFQLEKYEDLFLRLKWTHENLRNLADKRINHLFRDQYTGKQIGLHDLIANRVGDKEGFEYILERTLDRPRDVISYLNECLEVGAGQSKISNKVVRDAEVEYSTRRMRSLADEWRESFGDLEPALVNLKNITGGSARFQYSEIDSDTIELFCLRVFDAQENVVKKRAFSAECSAFANNSLSFDRVRQELLSALYTVGAIGVKVNNTSGYEWSYRNRPKLDFNRVNEDSKFVVHPMLFKALGVYAEPKKVQS